MSVEPPARPEGPTRPPSTRKGQAVSVMPLKRQRLRSGPSRSWGGPANDLSARHWLVGLMIFLIALAVFAPAQLLVYPAAHYSAGRLALIGVSGSLWHGRAERLDYSPASARPLRLEGIEWRLLPHRLLTGQPPVFIESAGGDLTMSGWLAPTGPGWRPDGARLIGFRLEAALATVAERLGGVSQGNLTLRTEELRLGAAYAGTAKAELHLNDAGQAKIPTGRYDLDLEGRGERLAIRWNGPLGPRSMSGTAWWDGQLHLDGVPGLAGR